MTWLDGYLELRHRAFADRGAIELPDGTRWPRTTGEQVVAIAAAFTPAVRANAAPRVLRQWQVALADIQRDALADLANTFAGNRAFWALLETVAVHLDDLAVPPPTSRAWTALIALVAPGAARNAGPRGDGPFKHFDGVQTFDDLYTAQLTYLRDLRGADRLKPEGGGPGTERPVPRTTNADVIALADYWTAQLAGAKTIMGSERVVAAWRAATADVDQLARRRDPSAVYAQNNAFWRALQQTAIQVAIADEAPSKWDLTKGALGDSIKHLPDTLSTAASKGADALADTAHAAGHVLNEAGKGLLAGAGTPLLIGAGVVGALLLLRRSRTQKEA